MEIRDTRYVKTPDGVYIAYQTVGEGPIDFVWQFDLIGDVDLIGRSGRSTRSSMVSRSSVA
jgi:hypothetical protein